MGAVRLTHSKERFGQQRHKALFSYTWTSARSILQFLPWSYQTIRRRISVAKRLLEGRMLSEGWTAGRHSKRQEQQILLRVLLRDWQAYPEVYRAQIRVPWDPKMSCMPVWRRHQYLLVRRWEWMRTLAAALTARSTSCADAPATEVMISPAAGARPHWEDICIKTWGRTRQDWKHYNSS